MDVGLVCDACSTFNPMGNASCSRCGIPLSLDGYGGHAPRAPSRTSSAPAISPPGEDLWVPEPTATYRPSSSPAQRQSKRDSASGVPSGTGSATVACPQCGVQVTTGHRFCWSCGARMPTNAPPSGSPRISGQSGVPTPAPHDRASVKRTMFFGAMQAARAKLVLIKGDGLDGVSYTLAGEEHVAGRVDCPLLFDEDPFLSPTHANFFYRNGQLVVRDERSVNGVFVRIRGTVEIPFGARFLVGEQLLELQQALGGDGDKPNDDGTYFFASPRRPSTLRLVQALRGGETGLAYRAPSDLVSIGREGNDIDFPDDPFISGHHAQLQWDGERAMLTDLNSKNGTFLRIAGEQTLKHGDYVFMGQQLLRVEIV
jgi:pSer/pThr/pTyr-binding forkhead associated (FHA) protein